MPLKIQMRIKGPALNLAVDQTQLNLAWGREMQNCTLGLCGGQDTEVGFKIRLDMDIGKLSVGYEY